MSVAPRELPRSPSLDVKPQPLPTTDLPTAVWEDHLLPLLDFKGAARLACTCKALRGVVREHFHGEAGEINVEHLRAALTSFPRARSVKLVDPEGLLDGGPPEAMLQWLREGGGGRHLEEITVENGFSTKSQLVHEALQAGALPSLRCLDASLEYEIQRASLMGEFLGSTHKLRVRVKGEDENAAVAPQLAALSLVRQMPALAKLELCVSGKPSAPVPQWPPFIPRPLRELRINVLPCDSAHTIEPLICALPGMLGAGAVRLKCLELMVPENYSSIGDGLVHVAQALRCCSPTLKGFLTSTGLYGPLDVDELDDDGEAIDEEDYASQVERLRVQWRELLAGVSACRELQVLGLPRMYLEPFFPPGTAFARLTHLEISDHEREHPPDAGVMGLWELMASGGLPALAKLSVRFEGRWGGAEEVRSRVAPGLEAVAGILTHVHLDKAWEGKWLSDEEDAGHELGVAVGKLRRLKDLALSLSNDGRLYHAFAQGLAASGGNCPPPLLWRVWVVSHVTTNADLMASLLFPSVRVFGSWHFYPREALLTACVLRQAGYKHSWTPTCYLLHEPEECNRELHRAGSCIDCALLLSGARSDLRGCVAPVVYLDDKSLAGT
jgi:hypothetical protein